MQKLWFKFMFGLGRFFLHIGMAAMFAPIFVARCWWLVVAAILPFAGMAFYHHAMVPHLWWWGVTAIAVIALAGGASIAKKFPNG